MGWQEPHKVQQREEQSPSPGQAPVHAEGCPAGKQFCRKELVGFLLDTNLNMRHQYALGEKKVNSILGCIRQGITSRLREVILSLYSAMVKLHLEYCVQLWSPQCKSDMDVR